jgi:hypothetical protein
MPTANRRDRPTRAYLLRSWQERPAGPSGKSRWRYSLEAIWPSRSRQGFDDLESLVAFLQGQAADDEEESPNEAHETEGPKNPQT